ncbi:MAG: emp24/gp25L/p24 family protein [Candidatus Bathyarchaeota archaeon]|nr:MAG: emp24/gp25L/p24 family protein [Candidatus Bathyarchaeota archaeon]
MKHISTILCVPLTLCALLIGFAQGFSETFTVPAGDNFTKIVNLNEGDEVSGRVAVVGVEESLINFSISDPGNIVILDHSNIGLRDFKFTAPRTGTYSFHFQNQFSQETKHITLNYNVQHFIFGLPQELILVFVIVGLALIAIVVFIAMSPKP